MAQKVLNLKIAWPKLGKLKTCRIWSCWRGNWRRTLRNRYWGIYKLSKATRTSINRWWTNSQTRIWTPQEFIHLEGMFGFCVILCKCKIKDNRTWVPSPKSCNIMSRSQWISNEHTWLDSTKIVVRQIQSLIYNFTIFCSWTQSRKEKLNHPRFWVYLIIQIRMTRVKTINFRSKLKTW